MAIHAVADILGVVQVRIVVGAAAESIDHVGLTRLHTGQVGAHMNLVDHYFHVDSIGAVGICGPGVVTGDAVLYFATWSYTAAMHTQGVMAAIAGRRGGNIHGGYTVGSAGGRYPVAVGVGPARSIIELHGDAVGAIGLIAQVKALCRGLVEDILVQVAQVGGVLVAVTAITVVGECAKGTAAVIALIAGLQFWVRARAILR